jgi:putative ABC transport system substrate-binding protein
VVATPIEARVFRDKTSTIPIVFSAGVDPVSQGIVDSLALPGGNITGCSSFEFSMGGKWVQYLIEIKPTIKRESIVFNPEAAPYIAAILDSIGSAATASAVEVAGSNLRPC